MNSVRDLKNAIDKSNAIIKQEQENLQERMLNGLYLKDIDDLDNNPQYYQNALKSLENAEKTKDEKQPENVIDEIEKETKIIPPPKQKNKNKILQNLKKIFLDK